VREGLLLQPHGNVQQLVVAAELAQDVVGGGLDDLRARVVVLVDPVPEAHEADTVLLVLDLLHEVLGLDAVGLDGTQHLQHGLVGTAVGGAEEGADARGDGGEHVGVHEPTRRTVEVEQFCSWSACRISSWSRALTRSGSRSYGSAAMPKFSRMKFSTRFMELSG